MTKKKDEKDKKKNGRPLEYTEEIGALICERIATSDMGLPRLCAAYDDLPAETTINRWRYLVPSFRTRYAQAKMQQAELLAEQCIAISDDSSRDFKIDKDGNETVNGECVARSRLRVDTRKWLASKLLPKQYGDRLVLEQKTEENERLKEELAALRLQLGKEKESDY